MMLKRYSSFPKLTPSISRNFALQFEVAEKTKLPLFLHCRNAATDLLEILNRHRDSYTSGVVHSFDGTYEEAKSFLDLGLYIGLNGCSLKTDANLEVVQKLPIDRLLIETGKCECLFTASFIFEFNTFATLFRLSLV